MEYAGVYECDRLLHAGVKPDTELLYMHVDYDTTGKYTEHDDLVVDKTEATRLRSLPIEKGLFSFVAPVYSREYAQKAQAAITHYQTVRADVESIQADDDQYDDPALWNAADEMRTFMAEPGLWWDYSDWR